MKQWDYMVRARPYTEIELNELGRIGWELCTMDYDIDTNTDIYIFKRLIE